MHETLNHWNATVTIYIGIWQKSQRIKTADEFAVQLLFFSPFHDQYAIDVQPCFYFNNLFTHFLEKSFLRLDYELNYNNAYLLDKLQMESIVTAQSQNLFILKAW